MKFTTKKQDMVKELQILQGIVEKRNTMPILANILIKTRENEVELTGTDLEVGLKTKLPAKVEIPGSITVSGKKTFEIVRSLREDIDITFVVENQNTLVITSGASEFRLVGLPEEDYPPVVTSQFEKEIRFPLDIFQKMIDRVFFAIAQEQRYYLNGALMVLSANQIELVSTDGYRLAYVKAPLEPLNIEGEIRCIISKKTLNEIRKFDDSIVDFDLDESNLFFQVGQRILISRIIEGKFPNYEAVIPTENPFKLKVSREELLESIRRVSLLSSDRTKGVKFQFSSDKIILFSSNPEIGEAKDEVKVEYEGDELEVGFNAQYILDFLTISQSEMIKMELKDSKNAALLQPDDDTGLEYLYVLMPMNI
ncbi:MAG: DNA polymerase III subunit beta [Candidatus Aminicenantes bacterium]|nr:DNA polymerase III subunit beta [Candidatus Aminicenantes bacterium]